MSVTLHGLLKTECYSTTVIHTGCSYKIFADIEYTLAGWVDGYNPAAFTAR